MYSEEEYRSNQRRVQAKTFEVQMYSEENDGYFMIEDGTGAWDKIYEKLKLKYPNENLRVVLCVG